jgi:hypothetical protein
MLMEVQILALGQAQKYGGIKLFLFLYTLIFRDMKPKISTCF